MSENIPKNYKIVSVGGTGQMVMHYYLQLHLLGLIEHDFDLVVVDSDEILPSIQTVQRFLKDLQYGSQSNEALGKIKVPTIETVPIRPISGDTAHEVLTGDKEWNKAAPHPAHALFNMNTLRQNLKQGLFARPALSSVLSQEIFLEDNLKPRSDSTIILVGSVTGGTGGGLIAPIMDAILLFAKLSGVQNIKIRAVFFGEYFKPTAERLKNDVQRFQSNQTLVLRSIREAGSSDELHSYHIVGGPGFNSDFERQPKQETEGKNLPWPKDEFNPFWQGAVALEHMLRDRTAEKQIPFERREITKLDSHFNIPRAQLRLKQALEMVYMLRKKNALVRMCHDPWARWIWGEELIDIVSHYWSIAEGKEGSKVSKFPVSCQRAIEAIWRGEDGAPGLGEVFPLRSQRHRMSPGKMARIRWPGVVESTLSKDLFENAEQAARRAAASILYWTLREVK